jgi:hypothetical protein
MMLKHPFDPTLRFARGHSASGLLFRVAQLLLTPWDCASESAVMNVSTILASQSGFQFRSAQSVQKSQNLSGPVGAGVRDPQASSGQGGSYDFTSLTPDQYIQTINELYKAGKISSQDFKTAPFGSGAVSKLLGSPDGTQTHNFLERLQNVIDYDKQSPVAQPGQVEREQSLLDTLTDLQGTPKGVDKLA